MADTARIQQGREIERPEWKRVGKGGQPTHIDLFSGIGGFALAAKWAGFRTIAFCEIDKYCQQVIAKHFMADAARNTEREQGHESGTVNAERNARMEFSGTRSPRILSNIFGLDGTRYRGCDLLTGGFPCQPFSVAGKRRGAADDRAIWPEMFRVIKEARPAWVLIENVPGIIPLELDNVLSDLESIGYATRPFVIPACAVDAKHRRDRVWIIGRNVSDSNERGIRRSGTSRDERHASQLHQAVADTEAERLQGERTSGEQESHAHGQSGLPVREGIELADTEGNGERAGFCEDEPRRFGRRRSGDSSSAFCEWEPEPDVGRVAHGIPKRVDRLKGLGNAIVPQVAYEILREIRLLI